MTDRLLNNWYRACWFIQCSFGRHSKYPVVKAAGAQPYKLWCLKCNREWPIDG